MKINLSTEPYNMMINIKSIRDKLYRNVTTPIQEHKTIRSYKVN